MSLMVYIDILSPDYFILIIKLINNINVINDSCNLGININNN